MLQPSHRHRSCAHSSSSSSNSSNRNTRTSNTRTSNTRTSNNTHLRLQATISTTPLPHRHRKAMLTRHLRIRLRLTHTATTTTTTTTITTTALLQHLDQHLVAVPSPVFSSSSSTTNKASILRARLRISRHRLKTMATAYPHHSRNNNASRSSTCRLRRYGSLSAMVRTHRIVLITID
ncbi:hypothetical protein EV177_009691 [Coemansia sp. RSA 1804]|nr:hypothetical protein EV177_009691 [Coemansia sp. RSA 1804]